VSLFFYLFTFAINLFQHRRKRGDRYELVLSREVKLQTHRTVREISGRRVFIGHLCPRLSMVALCNRADHYIFAL